MTTGFGVTRAFGSAIRLMAALVVLSAQVGIAGAGVLDAREGASAASHLESGGTNLHFAHNEADCFMCRAQHLGDASLFNIEPQRSIPPQPEELVAQRLDIVSTAHPLSNASRAPPTAV